MSEKFEIKNINDLLYVFENTDGYYLGDYTCFQIADYIRKMYNQLQQKENVIEAVREYIEKHRHKSSENFIQTCENFIKEQEYLLSILDKDGLEK